MYDGVVLRCGTVRFHFFVRKIDMMTKIC